MPRASGQKQYNCSDLHAAAMPLCHPAAPSLISDVHASYTSRHWRNTVRQRRAQPRVPTPTGRRTRHMDSTCGNSSAHVVERPGKQNETRHQNALIRPPHPVWHTALLSNASTGRA